MTQYRGMIFPRPHPCSFSQQASLLLLATPPPTGTHNRDSAPSKFFDRPLDFIPNDYNPLLPCSIEGVVDRGVRQTEQGAAPDNVAALERREAQGSSQGPARPGTPIPSIHLGPGSSACEAGRSQGRLREPRKLPGASRRSNPSSEGERKTGRRASRPPEYKGSGRRSVGCMKI